MESGYNSSRVKFDKGMFAINTTYIPSSEIRVVATAPDSANPNSEFPHFPTFNFLISTF